MFRLDYRLSQSQRQNRRARRRIVELPLDLPPGSAAGWAWVPHRPRGTRGRCPCDPRRQTRRCQLAGLAQSAGLRPQASCQLRALPLAGREPPAGRRRKPRSDTRQMCHRPPRVPIPDECQPDRQCDDHQYGIGRVHSRRPPPRAGRGTSTISSPGGIYRSSNERISAKGRSSS